ncbi:UNVERIFIED_CONTAM: Hyoscyamine 6-dioxygenase [Sesamum radiatum]|uniref:Hyoscyamine 6-dioxygenase n=1 Tax=Sesamum radiatum TaxID=300843 RepID=A0AAW2W7Y3_SESRA
MEKLISSKHNIQNVPESYILPPERRPRKVAIHSCKCVPVIDLHGNIDSNRQELVQRIMKAGQEFGFFQLTNHGVPEELMKETVKVAEEFFQLPVEDMASLYSEDPRKGCRLYTSIDYDHEKVHFWRDNLRHHCHPLEDHVGEWPTNPTRYRDVIGNYAVRVRELSLMLLDLICEGSRSRPSSLRDEEWLALEPVPNAFVVNIGHALQVISNGMLRSAEHRVVTNAYVAQTTVANFIHPSNDSLIQPATLLVDRCSLPLYRPFPYVEFVRKYIKDTRDGDPPMKEYEISET